MAHTRLMALFNICINGLEEMYNTKPYHIIDYILFFTFTNGFRYRLEIQNYHNHIKKKNGHMMKQNS